MPPVKESMDFSSIIDDYIKSKEILIFSKTTCPYCTKVKDFFLSQKLDYFCLELNNIENGEELHEALKAKLARNTVPQVFIKGQHVGGYDDTLAAYKDGRLQELLGKGYDYDLIVIGGGSGGLAASKEAARYGKKVAVLDFVVPTPKGTTWGLGGTCVNVGCIPKKLMHQAAIHGHLLEDSKKFGWDIPQTVTHDWELMRENINNYIRSLNWGYKVALQENSIQYLNCYGTFLEGHKIKAVDKKGKEKLLTAANFIVATGERPRYPDIPGATEYGITSDDLFSLKKSPGKTLVVGASYVALECAGFLAGIGIDATVMVRSIFLRGFDQEMAERIGQYMADHGVKIIRPCVPIKVEEVEADDSTRRLKVTSQMVDSEENIEEVYNTVLFAIGRDACTSGIGLENVGVNVNLKNGKLPNVNEQTNVPYIYGIGDVLEGRPELTPVAIEAGLLLARRLFGGSRIQCDYTNVPTTVFTPLEYGCIGLSEEDAIKKYGDENIEVYHSSFTPLEWTIAKRGENVCYAKVICLIPEKEKIIGFHYLGPNAGEITQGFALGLRLGATKENLISTIGIHPTAAEIFTTLSVSKRSGGKASQKGC